MGVLVSLLQQLLSSLSQLGTNSIHLRIHPLLPPFSPKVCGLYQVGSMLLQNHVDIGFVMLQESIQYLQHEEICQKEGQTQY